MFIINIVDAVKESLKSGKPIYRKSFEVPFHITPTDTDLCCVVRMKAAGKPDKNNYSARWNPSADDLTAEDWDIENIDD